MWRAETTQLSLPVNRASVRVIISCPFFSLNIPEGKTCFLYYVLVLRLIQSQPTVFQDNFGTVSIIDDEVREWGSLDGRDVLALVDADNQYCEPDDTILANDNYRVLLTSSPRETDNRKWMEQYCSGGDVLVMRPCSLEEIIIMAFVLLSDSFHDLTICTGCSSTKVIFLLPVF